MRVLLLFFLLLPTAAAWAIKPSAVWWAKPDTLGLAYQKLTLTTADHWQLAAWLIAPTANAPKQRTTIVLAGGDVGNMADYLYQAKALADAGYQTLLFDYRGFGHSQAFAIDPNRLYYAEFVMDLRAALAAARRRSPQQRVGILGYSMGALLGAEVATTPACDFLITDSYPANPQAVVAYYWRVRPERPLTLPAEAARYHRVAPRVNCPWLLIAGTKDPVTTLAAATAVVRAARPGQRRQVLPVKCGHMGAVEALTEKELGDAYVRAIGRFLAGRAAVASK